MMPLRLVEVDPSPYPLPRNAKAALELSRAVTLMMLDTEAKYYPMEIARLHYTWELLNNPDDAVHSRVNLLRKCYVQLANRNKHGTNPLLSGAGWQRMLASNLHQVAALMVQLREAQAAQPHTVFTLVDGVLVPYPDQTASLEAPRALVKCKGPLRFAPARQPGRQETEAALPLTEATAEITEPPAPVTPEPPVHVNPTPIATSKSALQAEQPGRQETEEALSRAVAAAEIAASAAPVTPEPPVHVNPTTLPATESDLLPAPLPTQYFALAEQSGGPETDEALSPTEATAEFTEPPAPVTPEPLVPVNPPTLPVSRSALRHTALHCLTWLMILCPFLAGVNGYVVDELYMEDIQAIGAPFHEAAHFLARGKRFEVGDYLRFEGEEGVIEKIDRYSLIIGGREYDVPTLFFFGGPMLPDGNYVVFPGDPRHIAGNFWLGHTDELTSLEPGYLSWLGGYWGDPFYICDAASACAFWGKVSGLTFQTKNQSILVIPEQIQLDFFLESLTELGARIEEDHNGVIISWE